MVPAEKLDGAKSRLQAAAEPAKETRAKAASTYTVFVATGGENDFRLLQQGVIAATRKAAILAVSSDSGTFLAIPDAQFQPLTRKVETTTVDKFE